MRFRPLIAALALLLALPLCRAGAQTDPQDEGPGEDLRRRKIAFVGEITDLEETSFRIRPWDPRDPNRIQVTASPETRYLKQEKSGRGMLKPGDLVLVIEDPHRAPEVKRKKNETPDEKAAREAKQRELLAEFRKKPIPMRAILRLWPAADGAPTLDDVGRSNALLLASRGYFRGIQAGGVNPPGDRTPRVLGIVKAVRPLTVEVKGRERVYDAYNETLWIDHLPRRPEDLRKGDTVLIQTAAPLGADGTVQATLIAECPKPRISPKIERRLILRERRSKD